MRNEHDNDEMEKDDIINPEQFQVGRTAHADDADSAQEEMVNRDDDAGYTPEENQFADGKGTQLNEEIHINGNAEEDTDEKRDI